MHTVKFLTTLVEHHQIWAYAVIFLGLIFEGEVVVITTGVLAYLGALDFSLSLLFIFTGSFVKTFILYYLGEKMNQKFNGCRYFQYVERRVLYFMPRFKQKPFWSIFWSKFIMGTNYLVILFSGWSRINLKTFAKAEIISTVIWAPSLLCLGYFFSSTAISISKELGKFSLIIFALIVAFLFLDKIISSLYTVYEYVKNGLNGNHHEHKN